MNAEDALDEWWRERCELEALMQEPPGGHNHGWLDGESLTTQPVPFVVLVAPERAEPRQHGTGYTYNPPIRCRCDECRAWNAERMRRYRELRRA